MKTDTRSSKTARGRRAAPEERTQKQQALKRSTSGVYRAAILEAAERVFGQRSYADAKIAEIAREAGMAAGTLYNYFDSKESIFRSLIEKLGEELLGQLDAVSAAHGDPLARLRALVDATLAHLERHRQMFLFVVQLGTLIELGLDRVAGENAEKVQKRCVRHFELAMSDAIDGGLVRADIDRDDLVQSLLGILHGQVRAWASGGARRSLTSKTGSVVDLFLRGAEITP